MKEILAGTGSGDDVELKHLSCTPVNAVYSVTALGNNGLLIVLYGCKGPRSRNYSCCCAQPSLGRTVLASSITVADENRKSRTIHK